MLERAKRASAQNHRVFNFISQELQFNAFAFHITTWKYKRLTHWQATVKRSISRKCTISERAWNFFAFISIKTPRPPPPPPPTQYYLGYVYACSLPLKAPPYLRTGKQFSGRTLSREKYPFTGDLGNTHAVPPTPEWGGRAKLLYLSMFELVYLRIIWCFSVTLLHLCIQCILLITWHYKRLTSYRQNTYIEIIYSMRARKATEENFCISAFQTCYISVPRQGRKFRGF